MQYARMLPLIAIAAFSIPLLTGCGGNVQVGGEFSCGGGILARMEDVLLQQSTLMYPRCLLTT